MLYQRLFKYAPRSDRTQLENFLTEAICDLLERITSAERSAVEKFIQEVFIAESEAASKTFSKICSAKHLTWSTQSKFNFRDQCGRPDLFLYSGTEILLVIENKVGAGFTTHHAIDGIDDGDTCNQLEFYDSWLAATFPEAGLVLLTHLTDSPPGFVECANVSDLWEERSAYHYKTVFRKECRWASVQEWLATWCNEIASQPQSKAQTIARALTHEFCNFLQEKSMSARRIENKDVEMLDLFFSQEILNKFRQLLAVVRTAAKPAIPNAHSLAEPLPMTEAWTRNEVIWDWSYCYETRLRWFVGWGIAAKDAFKDLEIVLPHSLQAFVVLMSDPSPRGKAIHLQQHELDGAVQNGWLAYDDSSPRRGPVALIKVSSSQQLVTSPVGFNRAFQDWAVGTIREGIGILEHSHNRLQETE